MSDTKKKWIRDLIAEFFKRPVSEHFAKGFASHMRATLGLFRYDKIPEAFCLRCKTQLRWYPEFRGPVCTKEDGGCGWKPTISKIAGDEHQKQNKHSGDTTVLSFKP